MKVLKFGGTSVGSPESIRQVAAILASYQQKNQPIAVIASAMQGITNQLIETGRKAAMNDDTYRDNLHIIESRHLDTVKSLLKVKHQSHVLAEVKKMINELDDLMHGVYLLKELSVRTLDLLLSFGERLSCYILSAYTGQEGLNTEFLDARQLIKTDDHFGNARVKTDLTNKNIIDYFNNRRNTQIVTGFISSTEKGETTTLGRGGSDYTAAIIGGALDAEEIEIWTDVDGVMTTDPKMVKKAFALNEMTYEEAMEMSHFGAKVIYPPTLQPALKKKIPLRIRNTFNPEFTGTLIHENASTGDFTVKGISSINNISLINFQGSGMVGVPGVSSRLFGILAHHQISVILITQASSEHSICFALDPANAGMAKLVIEEEFAAEMEAGKIEKIHIEDDHAVVAIIGENMRKTPGISGKMFNALGKNGINVAAIAQGSSERNLSVVIPKNDLSKALNTIHEAFFLSDVKTLNVFLVGVGLIGGTLLKQIAGHSNYLLRNQLLKINVIGMANSKKMLFDQNGISLDAWRERLNAEGEKTNLPQYVDRMKSFNLLNSVFVDCTASAEVVKHYENILNANISITTPNKIATSGDFMSFRKLKDIAFRRGIKFLYETNVGAGLPVITTLNDLRYSGDKVLKIEGVLSGTLSFIFNTFSSEQSFSRVVREAKQKGYTEPDPRDDLNGLDMARKILILAREVGFEMELSDVEIENILPQSCIKAKSVDEFFTELEKADDHFEEMRKNAEAHGKALRFIARTGNNKANIKLEMVDHRNPFYTLSGSDNMIVFTTDRYKERPLVIKGPGAGAEVTAAGVFAEIISLSHFLG